MKENSFPPNKPSDKSKWFKFVIIFSAIVFCVYQFGLKPMLDEKTSQKDTEIPFGYVGVITNKKTQAVDPEVLMPGKYQINTDLYNVDKVYTEKQTWHFGSDE